MAAIPANIVPASCLARVNVPYNPYREHGFTGKYGRENVIREHLCVNLNHNWPLTSYLYKTPGPYRMKCSKRSLSVHKP